ncbi:MAG: hypothetical protein HFH65_04870 [Lachnospiraceae bacterium]|jgi:hypothetical protein|nr:hypothetical protein [Lachnospiraceae bacterium]
MENNYNVIIEKTITKTKDKTLKWSCLDSRRELYKAPIQQYNITHFPKPLIQTEQVVFEESFFAPFNNGFIFLILRRNPHSLDISKPPILSFEINKNKYTKEILSTYSSDEVCSGLKRLYNLVENVCSDLDSFLDDFLNS